MQPDNLPQHPIDYLDSISTSPKQTPGASDKLFFGAIIGAVLVISAAVAFMLFAGGSTPKDELTRLSVRLSNLQSVSDGARANIVSSKLRATNTDLSLTLASGVRDIKEPLTTAGVDTEKISEAITSEEDITELTDTLEDARLNAVYDRTYAREMSYQLETLIVLIKQLESDVGDEAIREFLSETRANLEPLQEEFSTFTESTP